MRKNKTKLTYRMWTGNIHKVKRLQEILGFVVKCSYANSRRPSLESVLEVLRCWGSQFVGSYGLGLALKLKRRVIVALEGTM